MANQTEREIKQKLTPLHEERDRIAHEIEELESALAGVATSPSKQSQGHFSDVIANQPPQTRFATEFYKPVKTITKASSTQEKYEFFMSLFSGRPDVHARRFQSGRSGKTGYSPVCKNNFNKLYCSKNIKGIKRIRCRKCEYGDFPPIDMDAFIAHTQGKKDNCDRH